MKLVKFPHASRVIRMWHDISLENDKSTYSLRVFWETVRNPQNFFDGTQIVKLPIPLKIVQTFRTVTRQQYNINSKRSNPIDLRYF